MEKAFEDFQLNRIAHEEPVYLRSRKLTNERVNRNSQPGSSTRYRQQAGIFRCRLLQPALLRSTTHSMRRHRAISGAEDRISGHKICDSLLGLITTRTEVAFQKISCLLGIHPPLHNCAS